MAQVKGTKLVVCDGCGVEVTWRPVTQQGRVYCCKDCAQGLPCECGDLPDPDMVDLKLGRMDFLPD